MDPWQLFLLIASAHFLALLSPGPDFFLIVRSAVIHGPRIASGVCAGVALANGVHIGLAISGVSLLNAVPGLLVLIKACGCTYLAWLGVQFLRSSGRHDQAGDALEKQEAGSWWRECRTGFSAGLLNPKNILFYASLFSLGLAPDTPHTLQMTFGLWMFMVVLLWDIGIAHLAGHPAVVRRFMAHLRRIEQATGVILLALAAGMAGTR